MAKIYNYENALLQVLATGSQHTSRHGITEEGHLQIGAAPPVPGLQKYAEDIIGLVKL